MAKFSVQFRKSQGEHGLYVIEETGFCLQADVAGIETGVVRRYKFVPVPNTQGVVLKVLDGSSGGLTTVTPAYGQSYSCAKLYGGVDPAAPAQPNGPLAGEQVLSYRIVWQSVGNLSVNMSPG